MKPVIPWFSRALLCVCVLLAPMLAIAAVPGYTRLNVLLKYEMSTLETRSSRNSDDPLVKLKHMLPYMKPLVNIAAVRNTEDLYALRRHRLTRYMEVDTSSLNEAQAEALLAEVKANPLVETAQFEPVVGGMERDVGTPLPAVPRAQIPDYTPQQNYLRGETPESPYKIGGINAVAAWNVPGGKGDGVRVISIESDHWAYDHVDLPKPFIEHWEKHNHRTGDHDTMSVGTIASQDNGFGTTGIAPHVTMGYSKYDGAEELEDLAKYLHAGDVIHIGVHYGYGSGGFPEAGCTTSCYMPVEWSDPVRDAIQYLTQEKGVHVVIAAANGNIDLDHPYFDGYFDHKVFDSGSIYAGAVSPSTGLKSSFSQYGSRVDLFSWGSSVTTTEWSPSNPTSGYTHTFSGTSSANPILAGVVASLQGVAKAHGLGDIPPLMARKILVDTGYPQINGNRTQIGVQPDLALAIAELLKENEGRPPTGRLAVPEEVHAGDTFEVHVYAESPDNKPLTYSWDTAQFVPISGTTASLLLTAPMVSSDSRKPVSVTISDGTHSVPLSREVLVLAPDHPPGGDCAPPWERTKVYATVNEKVSYEGYNYESAHWTQGAQPDKNWVETGAAKGWRRLEPCSGGGGPGPSPGGPPTGTLDGHNTVAGGQTITFTANARSQEGHALSYRWTQPAGLTGAAGNTRQVTWTARTVAIDTPVTIKVDVSDQNGELPLSKVVTIKAPASGNQCAPPWEKTKVYATVGEKVSYNGYNYESAHWTQGAQPDLNWVPTGAAKGWRRLEPPCAP